MVGWAQTRGHALRIHPVCDNKALPRIKDFDCLFIMGGPMNICEQAKHPWLALEKALIREAVAWGKYVIIICLGRQLIA